MSAHIAVDHAALSAYCRRHHIRRLAFFGSVLRDDFRADGDVDVLVEVEVSHTPGWELVSMEQEFSALLGNRRVDLVTPGFLNHRIREQVLRDAETLYVAA